MIRINLLPIRQIRRRQRVLHEAIAFAAAVLVLLSGLGLTGVSLAQKVDSLTKQRKELQQKKDSFKPIFDEIEKLKKDKEALEVKLKAIKQLKASSQIAVRVIDEIANKVPQHRMWLQSLSYSPNDLQLSGVALDNSIIAQFMEEITKSPYFTGADLANSSQTEVASRKLKSFSLRLQVKNPQQEEEAAAAKPQENKPPEAKPKEGKKQGGKK